MSDRSCLLFRLHGNGARKQDVVFQMNVLMEVRLEALQCLVQRPIADAGVVGQRVIPRRGA